MTVTFEVTVTSSSADDLLTRRAPADDNLLTGACYAPGQRLAEQRGRRKPKESGMAENPDGQQRAGVQPGQAAPQYLSYLLRLWRSGSSEQWRGSLQATRPGDPHIFADIDKLFAFLREQLRQPAADRPQPGDFLAHSHGEETDEETGKEPEGGER